MHKNSVLKVIAAICCVCLLLAVFTACGNSKKNETTTTVAEQTTAAGETTTTKQAETTAQAADGETAIIGRWEYESGGFTYDFKEDGSGTYDAGGTLMKFTYTAQDGKLSITYDGNTEPMVLDYEISGDKLNVKDSLGNDTIYIKK